VDGEFQQWADELQDRLAALPPVDEQTKRQARLHVRKLATDVALDRPVRGNGPLEQFAREQPELVRKLWPRPLTTVRPRAAERVRTRARGAGRPARTASRGGDSGASSDPSDLADDPPLARPGRAIRPAHGRPRHISVVLDRYVSELEERIRGPPRDRVRLE
jgi:hypothetical protein